ncbi:MAG: 4Fe-4S dicluster domain-containing protein [Propionibacteriaceae bacterium]|jgi:ferredoxin like protein|nr:4Fe-4S dicluster domain-containing protein [Propionibacteriaceae bacterium]
MKLPEVSDRLSGNRFVLDEEESHIEVNQALIKSTGSADRIIAACPARVYSKGPDGDVQVEYAACLECGTCFAIATPGSLSWHYPRGGYGVQFRDG